MVCDDEALIRDLISDFLIREGYTVVEAEDGADLLQKLEQNPDTDLIILDVMMPEMDGWEACRMLRKTSTVPVIMLTARAEEFDHLMGFESGIDEYVTKPFSPAVLVKRVEALLKRALGGQLSADPQNGLVIDADAYTATVDGNALDLTLKEFEVLHMLYKSPGRVYTRDQLLENIWGYDYDGDERTIDSHIARIRFKLGETGVRLKTVYGLGYKLE